MVEHEVMATLSNSLVSFSESLNVSSKSLGDDESIGNEKKFAMDRSMSTLDAFVGTVTESARRKLFRSWNVFVRLMINASKSCMYDESLIVELNCLVLKQETINLLNLGNNNGERISK